MLNLPADLDRLWEPVTFNVGDRVVVHLSGECQARFECRSQILPKGTGEKYGHFADENGKWGTVIEVASRPQEHGHNYRVQFDEPLVTDLLMIYRARIYAAVELELLERANA